MNMIIADVNRNKIQHKSFVPKLTTSFGKTSQHINSDVLNSVLEPSEILDQHFGLQSGSHKDVKEYVIYFRHIMAFFADGSHCGLAKPKQFVAFLGYKDTPESIVLKENSVHIELVLNARCNINKGDTAKHIEFPSQSTFTSTAGDDYFVE